MRLVFRKSKISKEQIEKQAIEELEAAMARATPPSESERTWARGEGAAAWSASGPSHPAPLDQAQEAEPATAQPESEDLREEPWASPAAPEAQAAQEVDLDDIEVDEAEWSALDAEEVELDEAVVAPASTRATRNATEAGRATHTAARRSPTGAKPARKPAPKAGTKPGTKPGTKAGKGTGSRATAATRKAASSRSRSA